MSRQTDRMVYQRPDGHWVNKRNAAERAASLHHTQREAIEAARDMLRHQGGGALTIVGRDHRFRDKDSIPAANDAHPPRH